MNGSTVRALAAFLLAATVTPAVAGPPYETDDPAPTDLGQWEIYAFGAAEGANGNTDGTFGLDLNYGLAPGVQLTATLPVEFQRGDAHRTGRGDLELGVKYRFLNDEKSGFSAAIFPRVFLPTGTKSFSAGRVGLLLPVWLEKDTGRWSVFGGGGYVLQPGPGNRDHALVALAVTRAMSERLSLGVEAAREGADAPDARATTLLGVGAVYRLNGPFSLLAAAGPLFEDGGGRAKWHGYAALELGF